MKSLLTLERNFLSPDVQRRETICTPVKEKKKREMLEGKEIAEISWIPTNAQITDSLLKKEVPLFQILGFKSELKESLF